MGVVADQPGSAARDDSTAFRTSAAEAKGTWLDTSPVAGLKTSPKRALSPATRGPPMK